MRAETSPVKAPSFSQWRFWAEMQMLFPFTDSTAAGIAVNGGAITMSQWAALATSGVKAEKKLRGSACVLYIFQFPAITGRRIGDSLREKTEKGFGNG